MHSEVQNAQKPTDVYNAAHFLADGVWGVDVELAVDGRYVPRHEWHETDETSLGNGDGMNVNRLDGRGVVYVARVSCRTRAFHRLVSLQLQKVDLDADLRRSSTSIE